MSFPSFPSFFSGRPSGTSDRPASSGASSASRLSPAGELAPLLERHAPAATSEGIAAASRGDATTLQALLAKDPGLLTRKFRNGDSLLTAAAASGHKQVVLVLVAHAATQAADSQAEILNHRNDASDSALALAFKRFDDKLAELLLSQDATDVNRPDAQGNTALHLAIHHLSDLCLRIIERPGTELDVPNHQQETPLAIALRRKSQAVVKALLQSGRINLDREDSAGRTPLWQALALAEKAAQSKFWISHESSLNILKALAQAPGFQPDRPRPDGQTPEMFLRSLPDEEFSGKVMQILTEAADSRSGQAAERPAGLPGRPTPAADA